MSFLCSGPQGRMQHSRCSLIGAERKNPLFHLLATLDAGQDVVGFLGFEHVLPSHAGLFVQKHPQVFLSRAAFDPLSSQPVLVPGVAWVLYEFFIKSWSMCWSSPFSSLEDKTYQWCMPNVHFTLLDNVLFIVLNRIYMQAPIIFDFQSRTSPQQLSDMLQNMPPKPYCIADRDFLLEILKNRIIFLCNVLDIL